MDSFVCFPSEHELELVYQNKELEYAKNKKETYTKSVCVKPWGHEFLPYEGKKVAMWCLTVNQGNSTSLHCHFKKDTLLIVLSGSAKIGYFDGTYQALSVMQSLFIPKKKFHSIGTFSETSTLLEIEIFSNDIDFSDKNDLLRINDQYHRRPVGYQSSVTVLNEGLEAYGYFELTPGTDIHVDGVRLQMNRFDHVPKILPKSHTILIEGNLLETNTVMKEGSILKESSSYTCLEAVTLLTLSKFDWKEDKKIIYGFEHLQLIKKELQTQHKKIILTSGCFDILHVGHVHTLKVAKRLGDILIVCLSSDEQIRALKGDSRPINKFEDRLNLFKTIDYVDFIFPYQEDSIEREETLGSVMKALDPQYWVKGSDYTVEGIKEKHPYLRNIHLVPLMENRSTTTILKKISKSLKS